MKKPYRGWPWSHLCRAMRGRPAAPAQGSRRFRPRLEWLEPRLAPAQDTLHTALTPALDGSPTYGDLADRNQVDLYVIPNVQAGDELTADLSASNGAGQPGDALRLFDAGGNQLAFQENPGGAPNTPTLTFDAVAAGTYYLGVSSDGNYDYDPSISGSGSGSGGLADGPYTLTLNLNSQAFLGTETPGNYSPATAQIISGNVDLSILGQTAVQGTYAIGQTEYYHFLANEPGGLTATVTPGTATVFTPRLALYDDSGHLLIQSDAGADGTAQLSQNLQIGTYYLGVSAVADSGNASDDQSYVLASTFQSATSPNQPLPVGTGPEGIAAGDFNHDGNTDLVTANYDSTDKTDNTVSVLLGNGDGTFQNASPVSVEDANGKGIGPTAVVVRDFRNDGNLDIVTANYTDGTISVLLGNGDGTFQPAVTYAAGDNPISVAVGDFNGDGNLDLVVADLNYNATTQTYGPGSVSVLLGKGDGTFYPAVSYPVGVAPDQVATAEIDGRFDIFTANERDNTVSVLLGKGDGTFQNAVTYKVGKGHESVALGNFDGRLGIVTANNTDGTISVLLGNGDGTFRNAVTYKVGVQPQSVVVGQFNGHADIVTADAYSNSVSVLLGDGAGGFQPAVSYAVGYQPDAVTVGDFNHDGNQDIAVANFIDDTVSVLQGRGDGTFASTQSNTPVGLTPFGVATTDFNHDGDADLVTANAGDNTVSVLLGNGDGTFQPAVSYPVGNNPDSVAVGDFNNDGNPDIVTANYLGNTVSVLLGLGDGDFPARRPLYRGRQTAIRGGGGLHRRRRPGHRHRQLRGRHGVGAAGQRRRYVPARRHLSRGGRPLFHRNGRFQRPSRPRRRRPELQRDLPELRTRHGLGAAGQRRRHVPTRRPLYRGDRSRGRRGGGLQRPSRHRRR